MNRPTGYTTKLEWLEYHDYIEHRNKELEQENKDLKDKLKKAKPSTIIGGSFW